MNFDEQDLQMCVILHYACLSSMQQDAGGEMKPNGVGY